MPSTPPDRVQPTQVRDHTDPGALNPARAYPAHPGPRPHTDLGAQKLTSAASVHPPCGPSRTRAPHPSSPVARSSRGLGRAGCDGADEPGGQESRSVRVPAPRIVIRTDGEPGRRHRRPRPSPPSPSKDIRRDDVDGRRPRHRRTRVHRRRTGGDQATRRRAPGAGRAGLGEEAARGTGLPRCDRRARGLRPTDRRASPRGRDRGGPTTRPEDVVRLPVRRPRREGRRVLPAGREVRHALRHDRLSTRTPVSTTACSGRRPTPRSR